MSADRGGRVRREAEGPERIVVIGASTGGLAALHTVLAGLPGDFPWPVVIVQHRQPGHGGLLESLLARSCRLPVQEPGDKEPVRPGHVYVAPADYHLFVGDGLFLLSTDGPVSHARPSVDVLFESAAYAYGNGTVAVVLTGDGQDGARGAARVKASGGLLVVQQPDTAEAPMMPRSALLAAQADAVRPLAEVGPWLAARAARGAGSSAH